jgi:hypothetical protein
MSNENVGLAANGTLPEVLVTPASYYDVNKMLNQSFLKSSKFLVRFPISQINAIMSSENAREFSFLCDSVEFPGQTLTTSEFRMPGKLKLKVPYLRELNEVTLTFYHNSKTPIYKIFTDWISSISLTATTNAYFNEIVCPEIDIIQLQDQVSFGNQLKRYMTVKLIDAYPLNFASMPSNWADDGFHKMSVTFFYEDLNIDLFDNYDISKDVNNAAATSLDDFNTDERLRG